MYERNSTNSLDFSRVYEIEGLHLFDYGTQELDLASTKR